jgi:hypothetical protein
MPVEVPLERRVRPHFESAKALGSTFVRAEVIGEEERVPYIHFGLRTSQI